MAPLELMDPPPSAHVAPDDVISVSVGRDLSAWLVKSSGRVYRRPRGDITWEEVPGVRLTKIVASRLEEAVGINRDGELHRYARGTWSLVSGGAARLGGDAGEGLMALEMVREMLVPAGRARSRSSSQQVAPRRRPNVVACRSTVSFDLQPEQAEGAPAEAEGPGRGMVNGPIPEHHNEGSSSSVPAEQAKHC